PTPRPDFFGNLRKRSREARTCLLRMIVGRPKPHPGASAWTGTNRDCTGRRSLRKGSGRRPPTRSTSRKRCCAPSWPRPGCPWRAKAGLPRAKVRADASNECLALPTKKGWVKEAFKKLCAPRSQPYLARWFYRWHVLAEQARDIVQDMFLKFLANRLAGFHP